MSAILIKIQSQQPQSVSALESLPDNAAKSLNRCVPIFPEYNVEECQRSFIWVRAVCRKLWVLTPVRSYLRDLPLAAPLASQAALKILSAMNRVRVTKRPRIPGNITPSFGL
ncbi:MAG: hypothetical protein KME05_16155 [Gloeocapsa sp. UFS-A4-WI-NPMV-4B04]|nr:hypothetical protein [Gloeocapsa sp. UFS-A4-WI-NPMV-4B04]